jgi:hypothetical protein
VGGDPVEDAAVAEQRALGLEIRRLLREFAADRFALSVG